jgi:SAM-dependent methyltransferase
MPSRHLLFRVFYAVGFTPWDGHPLSTKLRELVEGTDTLLPGSALDVGCGTGDASIYLAQHGWQVTGVDFTPKALDKARAKARAAGVTVNFVHADVTHLRQAGISPGETYGTRSGGGQFSDSTSRPKVIPQAWVLAWGRLSSTARALIVIGAIILVVISVSFLSTKPWESQREKDCRAAMEAEGYKGKQFDEAVKFCVNYP